MSVWTHVNASFRLDSLGMISDEKITSVIGKELMYDEMDWLEDYDENEYLPMGSEGTLNYSVWHNPNESIMASTTVTVFGDLRDYDNADKIEVWFNKVCNSFHIRQAVCQVEVEFRGINKVFVYDRDKKR